MKVDLSDNVALVTGAGSGIGRAIALHFAENGANVAVNDIDGDAAEETVARLADFGVEAHAAVADVSDYEAVTEMVEEVVGRFGRIDLLVNNAGWDKLQPFKNNTPEDWDRLIGVNFRGPIHVTHAVAQKMMDRKSGTIVNVASDAGRVGSLGEAVYSGCKGGLIAISKTWAREFARDGIRVNVVCPGLTDTPLLDEIKESSSFGYKVIGAITKQIPLGLGRPEQVARAVLFLASDDADYITGQVLSVSGGLTFHD